MSFKINWPKFSPEFVESAKTQLTDALNKGDKPDNIVDHINVKDLDMGTKPPDLEILEIGELTEERFRGIFKLVYAADAYVVLQTKVQANPLTLPKHERRINNRSGILAANRPLIVPMQLRISNLRLRGIIVLVVDKHKGVTLVFKNDPLEKVDVNSTFDNIPNIRRFLQNQIEGQLRKMFQDDLPQLIHNLSLMVISKGTGDDMGMSMGMGIAGHGGGKNGKRHDPLRGGHPDAHSEFSTDSGYHSEDFPYLIHNPHISEEHLNYLINRPHEQKWAGNTPPPLDGYSSDFDADTGYVLYKSLTPSWTSGAAATGTGRGGTGNSLSGSGSRIGLGEICDDTFNSSPSVRVVTRDMLSSPLPPSPTLSHATTTRSYPSQHLHHPHLYRYHHLQHHPHHQHQQSGRRYSSFSSSSQTGRPPRGGSTLAYSDTQSVDDDDARSTYTSWSSPAGNLNHYASASYFSGYPGSSSGSAMGGSSSYGTQYYHDSEYSYHQLHRTASPVPRSMSPQHHPQHHQRYHHGNHHPHHPHHSQHNRHYQYRSYDDRDDDEQLFPPNTSSSYSSPSRTQSSYSSSSSGGVNGTGEHQHRVVLQPSDNQVAAHLANLLNSNHTISPHTATLEAAFTFRSSPPSQAKMTGGANGAGGAGGGAGLGGVVGGVGGVNQQKRRVVARSVRRLRIPNWGIVSGLGGGSGLGSAGSSASGSSSSLVGLGGSVGSVDGTGSGNRTPSLTPTLAHRHGTGQQQPPTPGSPLVTPPITPMTPRGTAGGRRIIGGMASGVVPSPLLGPSGLSLSPISPATATATTPARSPLASPSLARAGHLSSPLSSNEFTLATLESEEQTSTNKSAMKMPLPSLSAPIPASALLTPPILDSPIVPATTINIAVDPKQQDLDGTSTNGSLATITTTVPTTDSTSSTVVELMGGSMENGATPVLAA
ncbi:ERMES complex subunit [Quaeritorhiza haematococci]|nr:ERMES complex subunit [Quaeritorhiza haematococci]